MSDHFPVRDRLHWRTLSEWGLSVNVLKYFRHSRRLTSASGIVALIFVLAGCSPGTVVTAFTGTSNSTSFSGKFKMTCRAAPSNAHNNCTGSGYANIGGRLFTTTSGTGGTGDNSDPNNSPADCTAAPCSQNAGVEIYGNGIMSGRTVSYTLVAYDPDPSTADSGTLTVDGTNYDFNCFQCVEVLMQPGTTPNG